MITNYWCWHWTISFTPSGKEKYKGTTGCGNWLCRCGEQFKQHDADGLGHAPNCKEFYFDNNDRCTLECQILFKLLQPTNLLLNENT